MLDALRGNRFHSYIDSPACGWKAELKTDLKLQAATISGESGEGGREDDCANATKALVRTRRNVRMPIGTKNSIRPRARKQRQESNHSQGGKKKFRRKKKNKNKASSKSFQPSTTTLHPFSAHSIITKDQLCNFQSVHSPTPTKHTA